MPALRHACAIAGRRPLLAGATVRTYARNLEADLDALKRITPSHAAGRKLQKVIKGCRPQNRRKLPNGEKPAQPPLGQPHPPFWA
jgi:hypothetical protein